MTAHVGNSARQQRRRVCQVLAGGLGLLLAAPLLACDLVGVRRLYLR